MHRMKFIIICLPYNHNIKYYILILLINNPKFSNTCSMVWPDSISYSVTDNKSISWITLRDYRSFIYIFLHSKPNQTNKRWQEDRDNWEMSFYIHTLHRILFGWSRIRWSGLVTHMAKMRYAHTILVRKPHGKRSFGRLWSWILWKHGMRIRTADM